MGEFDENPRVLLAEAERCLQQNNYSRTRELSKKVTDLDPEIARAWELLATAQKWDGLRDEATETVQKARDLYEVESEGLKALAKELEQKKSSDEIAQEHEVKGEGFFSKRQYDLAAECYAKAVEVVGSPNSNEGKSLRLRVLRRHADCAQQLQDWHVCRRCASEILEAEPNDARALLQRAAANDALEKYAAGLEDARRLLAIDPKNAAGNRILRNCQQAIRSGC